MSLPERPFGGWATLYADPPWRFANYSAKGEVKNPVAHYACMTLDEMAKMPVAQLAAPDSACFMWATFPMLPEALALMEAWNFDYRTGGAWAKQSSTGRKLAFGTGYIFRSAAELLLVGVRGKPTWLSKSERNLWLAPIREHSRKPNCVVEMIERLAPGPYCELFARTARPNWSAFGNEIGKFEEVGARPSATTAAPPGVRDQLHDPGLRDSTATPCSEGLLFQRLRLDDQAERED